MKKYKFVKIKSGIGDILEEDRYILDLGFLFIEIKKLQTKSIEQKWGWRVFYEREVEGYGECRLIKKGVCEKVELAKIDSTLCLNRYLKKIRKRLKKSFGTWSKIQCDIDERKNETDEQK